MPTPTHSNGYDFKTDGGSYENVERSQFGARTKECRCWVFSFAPLGEILLIVGWLLL